MVPVPCPSVAAAAAGGTRGAAGGTTASAATGPGSRRQTEEASWEYPPMLTASSTAGLHCPPTARSSPSCHSPSSGGDCRRTTDGRASGGQWTARRTTPLRPPRRIDTLAERTPSARGCRGQRPETRGQGPQSGPARAHGSQIGQPSLSCARATPRSMATSRRRSLVETRSHSSVPRSSTRHRCGRDESRPVGFIHSVLPGSRQSCGSATFPTPGFLSPCRCEPP